MKVARFARNGSVSIGLVKGDGIISLSPFDKGLSDIDEVVAAEGWARAEKLMTREPDLKIGDVEFLPPLSARARVFCVGFNYKAHVDETGNEAPAYPTFSSERTRASLGIASCCFGLKCLSASITRGACSHHRPDVPQSGGGKGARLRRRVHLSKRGQCPRLPKTLCHWHDGQEFRFERIHRTLDRGGD